jgi:inorganic phosphate transporter, PiT family
MLDPNVLLFLIVGIALIFDLTNGIHDSANAIATVVSTKVMSPAMAVAMAAVLNFTGAFVGTKVAHTIGSGIVNPNLITGCQSIVLAALIGAICWNIITWFFGLPSSSSHALIGGLIGATIMNRGWAVVNWHNIMIKIIVPLFVSPLLGFLGGYILFVIIVWLSRNSQPARSHKRFKVMQIFSSGFMATSHGMNDAQKTMGIITLALFAFNKIPVMTIPFWVKFASAIAMLTGTSIGGWRIIKTMGHKLFKMEPMHGFAAETAAATVIATASALGAPISTTHAISSSVMGVGAAKRISAVRWGVVGNMVFAWIITIPSAAFTASLCMGLLELMGLAR